MNLPKTFFTYYQDDELALCRYKTSFNQSAIQRIKRKLSFALE